MNGGKEEKIKIDRPVIVEGVYDKCALSSIIDATVITTGGFSVFNNREKQALIRALAKDLRISVITTKRAFDDLERDGFICTVQGKGSFVAAKNREMLREELLKQAEQKLLEAIEIARQGGISQQELLEMFQVLCQGE